MYVKATLQDFPSHAPMISTREAIRHLNIREADEQPRHLNVCADVTWYFDYNIIKFQKKKCQVSV